MEYLIQYLNEAIIEESIENGKEIDALRRFLSRLKKKKNLTIKTKKRIQELENVIPKMEDMFEKYNKADDEKEKKILKEKYKRLYKQNRSLIVQLAKVGGLLFGALFMAKFIENIFSGDINVDVDELKDIENVIELYDQQDQVDIKEFFSIGNITNNNFESAQDSYLGMLNLEEVPSRLGGTAAHSRLVTFAELIKNNDSAREEFLDKLNRMKRIAEIQHGKTSDDYKFYENSIYYFNRVINR